LAGIGQWHQANPTIKPVNGLTSPDLGMLTSKRDPLEAMSMRRREFITLLGGAAAMWPLPLSAQQADRMRRVGVLMSLAESDPQAQARVAAFREGLEKLGWTEDRNTRIDARWATADVESTQRFANELVALQPDLIFSHNTPTTATLLQQTRTIPIVFAAVSDPVGSGFVASFPRPGSNTTVLLGSNTA
jgi:putative tryptophan/tyrosine transport system substrate-binding protein